MEAETKPVINVFDYVQQICVSYSYTHLLVLVVFQRSTVIEAELFVASLYIFLSLRVMCSQKYA